LHFVILYSCFYTVLRKNSGLTSREVSRCTDFWLRIWLPSSESNGAKGSGTWFENIQELTLLPSGLLNLSSTGYYIIFKPSYLQRSSCYHVPHFVTFFISNAFSIHHVYPETLLNRLARSAFQVSHLSHAMLTNNRLIRCEVLRYILYSELGVGSSSG
jgi:hypothetical protein